MKPADWPDRLFATLKRAGVRQVGYVPDAGHSRLIDRCRADPDIRDVVLTTEEEGVALAAGAWLGGERATLLDAIERARQLRQHAVAGAQLPVSAADADHHARRVGGVQSLAAADGRIVDPVLKLCEAQVYRATAPDEVEGMAERAVQHVFGDERIAAVLLSQQLIGKKVWTK